jgi:hypothetical protein
VTKDNDREKEIGKESRKPEGQKAREQPGALQGLQPAREHATKNAD